VNTQLQKIPSKPWLKVKTQPRAAALPDTGASENEQPLSRFVLSSQMRWNDRKCLKEHFLKSLSLNAFHEFCESSAALRRRSGLSIVSEKLLFSF